MIKSTALLGLTGLFAISQFAMGGSIANPLITLDESGNGSLLFPGQGPILTEGVLQADPGPGGLPNALTYNLLGPPGLVAGDVFLLEAGSPTFSDLIRFNPAGTGSPGYPASVVFYSDLDPDGTAIADVGFPTAFNTNQFVIAEVAIGDGVFGANYTPTSTQPGYVPGFAVSYTFISDTPEPASASLAVGGIFFLGVGLWRKNTWKSAKTY